MKKQTNIRKLVGRIGNVETGEYFCCDYIFKHAKDFRGATATVLRPVSKEEYENAENPDNSETQDHFREAWREQVSAGATEQSFKDYIEEVLSVDFPECSFDFSGYDYWDFLRENESILTEVDYPAFDCIGGGRSFNKGMKFDKIYDKKLYDKIMAIES